MTGVIYARYSSDNQREESIEGQLRECQVFAKKNDITLLEPYIDRALSAKTDNRPNFQKMIKDSAAKKFDVVIVWKLDTTRRASATRRLPASEPGSVPAKPRPCLRPIRSRTAIRSGISLVPMAPA